MGAVVYVETHGVEDFIELLAELAVIAELRVYVLSVADSFRAYGHICQYLHYRGLFSVVARYLLRQKVHRQVIYGTFSQPERGSLPVWSKEAEFPYIVACFLLH